MSPSIFNKLPTASVCLCLIVKDDPGADESHCLLRCLNSCKGFITHVAAVFTHQHDGKHGSCWQLVRDWCDDHHVILYHGRIQWLGDFSQARNHCLRVVQEQVLVFPEWLLLLDCDEELRLGQHQKMVTHLLNNTDPAINAYMIPTVLHQHMLARINLVRNIPGWGYRYRHHETIELKGQAPSYVPMGNPTSPEAGPYVFTQHDGARSHDPAKFERDLASLREAWQEDGAPRYLFFLALTMANGKHPQEARHTFKLFIEYSKDPCEVGMVYYALLMLGRLNQSVLDCSYDPMLDLEKAYRLCPTRAEALGEIALLHGKRQEWEKAYVYALAAMQPVMPEHLEFLEPMWVQWRALDILTVCLINLGRYVEAVGYLNALLKRPALPARERPRVQEHLTNITRRPQP